MGRFDWAGSTERVAIRNGEVRRVTYPCKKCGQCCKSLHRSDVYRNLHQGDGRCLHLDEKAGLCSIYENRPVLCRIGQVYHDYFRHKFSMDEYYRLNMAACEEIRSTAG